MLRQMDKLGVSVMVGYVLLVTAAVVLGGVMYAWMKSYVPSEDIECPDGVSLIITDHFYNCTSGLLNISIKNNGRFDIAGYFIKGANNPNQSLATIELSRKAMEVGEMYKYANAVILGNATSNEFFVGNSTYNLYDLSLLGEMEFIEIIPVRWQLQKNKMRFVGCGEVTKFREKLDCDA